MWEAGNCHRIQQSKENSVALETIYIFVATINLPASSHKELTIITFVYDVHV